MERNPLDHLFEALHGELLDDLVADYVVLQGMARLESYMMQLSIRTRGASPLHHSQVKLIILKKRLNEKMTADVDALIAVNQEIDNAKGD
jgi:hypothetical protein